MEGNLVIMIASAFLYDDLGSRSLPTGNKWSW